MAQVVGTSITDDFELTVDGNALTCNKNVSPFECEVKNGLAKGDHTIIAKLPSANLSKEDTLNIEDGAINISYRPETPITGQTFDIINYNKN